jgi:RNA polymerase sigma-70 factor (ECF subfamily)
MEDSHRETAATFHEQFTAVFEANFSRLYRYLDRLSGEPELAADLAQEAFVRLYRRGSLPDTPEAWLITVAMNLFRNARTTQRRRRRLLTVDRAARAHADPPASADDLAAAEETRRLVRSTVDAMPERERRLLLLHAEGFSYREIAAGLELHEASVGTLLARARALFRERFQEHADAP